MSTSGPERLQPCQWIWGQVTSNKLNKGKKMIQAIYFALCFATMFLGLIIAIHIHTWIGLSIMILFGIKFMLQLPTYKGGR